MSVGYHGKDSDSSGYPAGRPLTQATKDKNAARDRLYAQQANLCRLLGLEGSDSHLGFMFQITMGVAKNKLKGQAPPLPLAQLLSHEDFGGMLPADARKWAKAWERLMSDLEEDEANSIAKAWEAIGS